MEKEEKKKKGEKKTVAQTKVSIETKDRHFKNHGNTTKKGNNSTHL
jgi:hypothetical protein